MYLRRRVTAKDLDKPPQRHERPDAFEQQESPLLLVPGEHCQHRGAGEIEHEVHARAMVQMAGLRGAIGEEDEQGAGDLNCLSHVASVPTADFALSAGCGTSAATVRPPTDATRETWSETSPEMVARALDDAAARLRELRHEQWADFWLASIVLVLALAATHIRPDLALPLFAGGVFVLVAGMRAAWRRWDLVDRLASDRDGRTIPEVRAYPRRVWRSGARRGGALVVVLQGRRAPAY